MLCMRLWDRAGDETIIIVPGDPGLLYGIHIYIFLFRVAPIESIRLLSIFTGFLSESMHSLWGFPRIS